MTLALDSNSSVFCFSKSSRASFNFPLAASAVANASFVWLSFFNICFAFSPSFVLFSFKVFKRAVCSSKAFLKVSSSALPLVSSDSDAFIRLSFSLDTFARFSFNVAISSIAFLRLSSDNFSSSPLTLALDSNSSIFCFSKISCDFTISFSFSKYSVCICSCAFLPSDISFSWSDFIASISFSWYDFSVSICPFNSLLAASAVANASFVWLSFFNICFAFSPSFVLFSFKVFKRAVCSSKAFLKVSSSALPLVSSDSDAFIRLSFSLDTFARFSFNVAISSIAFLRLSSDNFSSSPLTLALDSNSSIFCFSKISCDFTISFSFSKYSVCICSCAFLPSDISFSWSDLHDAISATRFSISKLLLVCKVLISAFRSFTVCSDDCNSC